MSNQLTDQHRRALTELIGKHDFTELRSSYYCAKCHMVHANPEFDNWTDYGKCIEAIGKDVRKFIRWLHEEKDIYFYEWECMTPAERCREIADWWIQRKEKG